MKRILLVFLLIISLNFPVYKSYAEPKFSDCLLPRASWSHVSLGAPLAPERLGNKSKVRFGILPFHFKDSELSNLTEDEKNDYFSAAKLVEKLSGNQVSVELVFFPTIRSSLNYSQARQMLADRDIGWATWNLSKSTFGIVKETVKSADQSVDFSNLDGVILINKSEMLPPGVAEAFLFFRTPANLNFFKRGLDLGYNFSFHESLITQEGLIDNAILLDRRYSVATIAHEMLHNFGLTDLYGPSTPPSIYALSLMASDQLRLLNYEKAVLGWMPLNRIKCYNLADYLARSPKEATFTIEDIGEDHLVIFKVSNQEAYFVEVLDYSGNRLMIFYRLKMEERPPIEVLSVKDSNNSWTKNATTFSINDIGKSFVALEFQLLFSNRVGQTATFHIVPNNAYASAAYADLLAQASENRNRALEIEKAKQEAEAKAAAELKAKQEAEAKVKVAKKKTTIACVKGKLTKKVTSVNPKCPAGYKKK